MKVYDGQYYVEYSVAHNRINKRFYWDSNENVLLYTLPGGSVSAAVGSKEYTDITEKKSEDYVILKQKERLHILPFRLSSNTRIWNTKCMMIRPA